MKSKKLAGIIGVVMLAKLAGAALLVEETWDYDLGSASTAWTNGTGLANGWIANYGPATESIVDGLAFGSMIVNGNAIKITIDSADLSYGGVARYMDTAAVTTGELWMAYLFQFDTSLSVSNSLEGLEVRSLSGNLRTGVKKGGHYVYMRRGSTTAYNPPGVAVKNGDTYLYVGKFMMGDPSGADSVAWVLSSEDYDSVINNGGLSESNLDLYGSKIINANQTVLTEAGTSRIEMISLADPGGVSSFIVDELRYGTTLDDVVASPVVVPSASIVGVVPAGNGLVELIVTTDFPADFYLQSTTDLVSSVWSDVAHSDNGANAFVETNLQYATESGSNRVVYVEADAAVQFFSLRE